MHAEELKPIAPGNPFHSDLFHMGCSHGTNCMVMYRNHGNEHQEYLIIVDPRTGERLKVVLNE